MQHQQLCSENNSTITVNDITAPGRRININTITLCQEQEECYSCSLLQHVIVNLTVKPEISFRAVSCTVTVESYRHS